MILRALIQKRYLIPLHTVFRLWRIQFLYANFGNLYVHLNCVLLTVVHKRNNLIVSLDTIDSHAHLAIPRARLQDANMVDGFPVSVVQREPFPIRGEARNNV
jgi:hypothetical protein